MAGTDGAILDASALLALLRAEPGAQIVGEALPTAAISAVNLAEVVGHFAGRGMPGPMVDSMIDRLSLDIVPVDAELGRMAGRLRPLTSEAGLSLGDRVCLALALQTGRPALTADRAWMRVASQIAVEVVLIR